MKKNHKTNLTSNVDFILDVTDGEQSLTKFNIRLVIGAKSIQQRQKAKSGNKK
jgi:hypothetical protein